MRACVFEDLGGKRGILVNPWSSYVQQNLVTIPPKSKHGHKCLQIICLVVVLKTLWIQLELPTCMA
ncbi:hypothetical protein LEMLEM_LOCUS15998 [Lemmus lemmus]